MHKEWIVAKRAKACATKFLLNLYQAKLIAAMIKHMWAVWPHLTRQFFNAVVWEVFELLKQKPTEKAKKYHVSALALLGCHGLFLLKILIRLAAWMVYFGMKDSILYSVFVSRVDMYISQLRKEYKITQKVSFSQAIRHLCEKESCLALWVWNLHHTPIHIGIRDPVDDLFHVWSLGSKKSLGIFFSRLPIFYQKCVIVMVCYTNMHGSNGCGLNLKCTKSFSILKDFMGENVPIIL